MALLSSPRLISGKDPAKTVMADKQRMSRGRSFFIVAGDDSMVANLRYRKSVFPALRKGVGGKELAYSDLV
jgi:hypothetical protein